MRNLNFKVVHFILHDLIAFIVQGNILGAFDVYGRALTQNSTATVGFDMRQHKY